jgi:L,D-peptidoglycan transpeptidase YkuD (ErfK/YbiS/YcfS/YnhG family)
MRQTDYPHSIKLLVHHNTPESVGKPIVGAGSSIFFHIWRRDGEAPTAGCTSMNEEHLRAFIARLKADKKPVYILLPRSEYTRLRQSWQLP